MKKFLPYLIAVISLFADQITKYLVVNLMKYEGAEIVIWGKYIKLHYITNAGAIFGLFNDVSPDMLWIKNIVLSLSTIIALVVVIYFFYSIKSERTVARCFVGLIIGGAIGNLLDRLFGHIIFHGDFTFFYGKVVDFIEVGIENVYTWPIFNVADAAITVGVILLLIYIFQKRKERIFRQQTEEFEQELAEVKAAGTTTANTDGNKEEQDYYFPGKTPSLLDSEKYKFISLEEVEKDNETDDFDDLNNIKLNK